MTHNGHTVSYDKLILATGSAPFVPNVPGIQKDGIFVYRTIEDLEAITAWGKMATRAVVIGGGLLGLEAAKAALDMGLETHVVEFASRLMPRQLDAAGSDLLRSKMEELGVQIHLSKNTTEFTGYDRVTGLQFADGTSLEADMVIISAGIKPRDEVARQAGLAVGPRGGIVVNDFLQTSDPNIYAIGECALHNGLVYGLVAPGYDMAEVVAIAISKIKLPSPKGEEPGERSFTGFDMSTKLKLIGVDVASFGTPFCEQKPHRPIVLEDRVSGVYKRLNVSPDGKYLLGGILVGEAEAYNMLLQTCKNRIALPPHPEDLLLPAREGSSTTGAGSGVMSLPDDALICSCEGVSKGAICQSITEQELTDVAAIKKCPKAGTGCGGCYVCGNGGAKSQHAQLLASDIDRETCIRYLDRFLMFYVKTADPLERTATWLNKLEGGMAYLKSVIIDDTLGLNAQFEQEMQYVVNTYQCEWQAVVENDGLRSQFRHFINAEDEDPTLAFVEERGQKRPTDW